MKQAVRLALASVFLAVSAQADPPPVTQGPVAESPVPAGSSLYDAATPFRLFDPSRLTMKQSYSLSFFNMGGASQSVGLYMNSIGYQIARPLYVQFDVGIAHQPGTLFGAGDPTSGARILPNFSLRFTPSPNFNLFVDVRTMPGGPGYYGAPGYGYYGNPGYGPWVR